MSKSTTMSKKKESGITGGGSVPLGYQFKNKRILSRCGGQRQQPQQTTSRQARIQQTHARAQSTEMTMQMASD